MKWLSMMNIAVIQSNARLEMKTKKKWNNNDAQLTLSLAHIEFVEFLN